MITGTYTAERKPVGYQQLTVADTAIGLTVPGGATRAVIRVAAQPLRYRDDGTNPTTTVGFPKAANDEFELLGPSVAAARFIRSTGTSAVLDILYYTS